MSINKIVPMVVMALASAANIHAQAPAATAKAQQKSSASIDAAPAKEQGEEHRFWDKENCWLFAGVGGSRTLDYFSTLNLRRRGDQEIFLTDQIVDNHAEFALIEAGGAGVSIGASYLFHHYGHHKLERWTSIVHIGLTTSGAVRNYCLKTPHPTATP